MAFRLVVPASCTVEIDGATAIRVNCLDGEVELTVELAVPEKPPVPAEYWQDTDPIDVEVELGIPIPNPHPWDIEDETVV